MLLSSWLDLVNHRHFIPTSHRWWRWPRIPWSPSDLLASRNHVRTGSAPVLVFLEYPASVYERVSHRRRHFLTM